MKTVLREGNGEKPPFDPPHVMMMHYTGTLLDGIPLQSQLKLRRKSPPPPLCVCIVTQRYSLEQAPSSTRLDPRGGLRLNSPSGSGTSSAAGNTRRSLHFQSNKCRMYPWLVPSFNRNFRRLLTEQGRRCLDNDTRGESPARMLAGVRLRGVRIRKHSDRYL